MYVENVPINRVKENNIMPGASFGEVRQATENGIEWFIQRAFSQLVQRNFRADRFRNEKQYNGVKTYFMLETVAVQEVAEVVTALAQHASPPSDVNPMRDPAVWFWVQIESFEQQSYALLALLVEYRVSVYCPYVWSAEYCILQAAFGAKALHSIVVGWEREIFQEKVQQHGLRAITHGIGQEDDESTLSAVAPDSNDESSSGEETTVE